MWPGADATRPNFPPKRCPGTYRRAAHNPDNLKSGITKACFFEPQVQRTYAEMLRHYGAAPLPARPAKPRDKTWTSYCTSLR